MARDLTADSSELVTVQNQRLSNIWIASGAEPDRSTQITFGSGEYCDLSWIPDGKILYDSTVTGNTEVWEINADGTGRRQLTADAGRNYAPSASPDGRYIVFQSNRTGIAQIWRMDPDGGNPKQLTSGKEDSNWPQCSPDGQWVLYQYGSPGAVWKVSIDGGTPIQLTDKFFYTRPSHLTES
jgi:Tol biopolymer transport system component